MKKKAKSRGQKQKNYLPHHYNKPESHSTDHGTNPKAAESYPDMF
jgi:hypothetical protein